MAHTLKLPPCGSGAAYVSLSWLKNKSCFFAWIASNLLSVDPRFCSEMTNGCFSLFGFYSRQQQQLPMVIGKIGPILEMGGGSSQFSSQPGKPSIASPVTQIIFFSETLPLFDWLTPQNNVSLSYHAAVVNFQLISTRTMLMQ